MKLLRLTATFGCLDHATLEFGPGLTLIEAPNGGGIVPAVGAVTAAGGVAVSVIPGPGGLHVYLQPVGAEDKFRHCSLRFV